MPKDYNIPSMSFPNFIIMWYCGDRSKNVAPLRLLKTADIKELKGGATKLSMMRTLIRHVERAARMGNLNQLVVRNWRPENARALYDAVKHFFRFPLPKQKTRRFETLLWKTYYNALVKRKGRLVGEIEDTTAQPARKKRKEKAPAPEPQA